MHFPRRAFPIRKGVYMIQKSYEPVQTGTAGTKTAHHVDSSIPRMPYARILDAVPILSILRQITNPPRESLFTRIIPSRTRLLEEKTDENTANPGVSNPKTLILQEHDITCFPALTERSALNPAVCFVM